MRVIPATITVLRLRTPGRHRLALAACISIFAGAFALNGLAQLQTLSGGVYSATQASQGETIYRSQCVECHGSALEGHSGPPLAGDSFVSNWSGHPLVDLVDKIQKTMPFGQAGTVSRKQATDLAAYILQTNKFPSGPAELTDERLASIGFPGTRSTNNTAPAPFTGVTLPPPEGNLAELMRAIAFPNANIIFNVQVNDPAITHKREVGPVFDYTQWGAGIYQGWPAIDQAAIALTETAPLFLTPGRKCQNGRPVPVNRADWKQYTEQVMEVGRLAHRASQAQDREAFEEISEKLTEACQKCHAAYRREGAGAVRCQ